MSECKPEPTSSRVCERGTKTCNVRHGPSELAAPPGSVPDGFSLLKSTDYFSVGDIVADCEGKWRGPIPQDSDMVGREIRGYLCSNTWGAQPACRAAARRNPAPNTEVTDRQNNGKETNE